MSVELSVDRNGLDWTPAEWVAWVTERAETRKRTFLNEPEEMIGAYNRERSNIDDYRGREILELLQNADDAGDGYGPNRILIRHWPDGLCVANTGVPFSTGGIKSLMVGNLSPKKLARTRQVGNRGLGFRSILSWTQSFFILSGSLHLAFSRSLAKSSLAGLVAHGGQLRATVEEWQRGGHEHPIPILACPAVPDGEEDARHLDAGEPMHRLWPRALALREQYDTVIALPFTESGADEQVLDQVESLNQELMLFLQHLQELIIETEGHRSTWRARRQRDEVTVTAEPGEAHPSRWRIHQRADTVPQDKLAQSERSRSAFEIQIAVPDAGGGSDVLHNYFPTKVRFPYPIVAHATLELTSNRQNLISSDANRYLVGVLADAVADVAEKSKDKEHPWRPLELLTTRGYSCDPVLEELGFGAALKAAAEHRRLIPCRDGQMRPASAARRLPVDADGWLPLDTFSDLALWTDDSGLNQALVWLGVPLLDVDEFRARANRVSPALTQSARAALLGGLLRHHREAFLPTAPPPALLVDRENCSIGPTVGTYLPPTAEMSYEPPAWMPLRFLSVGLVDELLHNCESSRERLVDGLRDAGYRQIHAYDFIGVASAISAHVNRQCREDPTHAVEMRCEGLRALRKLLRSAPESQPPKRAPGLRVHLPTRQGEWRSADQPYLGEPYSSGSRMESLLGPLRPKDFVAGPAAFGEEDDASQWEPLLMWLGACQYPRQEETKLYSHNARQYLQYLRVAVQYPIRFGEFEATTPEELSLSSANVTTVQNIEEILQESDPHAILAWLASDARFDRWRREGDQATEMHATFRVHTHRSCRAHPLPSYVIWLLRERAWLPTTDGPKSPPSRCLLVKATSPELHGILPCPAIDPNHSILRAVGVTSEDITRALLLVGVRASIQDLTWEQCYEIMRSLPEIDPTGKAATRLYRILAGKEEQETPEHAILSLQRRFKNSGRLWARAGGAWSYVPVQDGVYFAADATLPEPVTAAVPLIDLPRGRGADKLARIFGLRVLRSRDVSLQVTDHAPAPNAEVLCDDVQRLKPCVLALRFDSTPEVAGIGLFRRLEVVPSLWVTGTAAVNGTDTPFRLSVEGQSLVHGDHAYLVSHSEREPSLANPMLARHVASILSAVLQIERVSDFAQLAIARDPVSREQLLSDILGHDCSEVLARARDVLGESGLDKQEPWRVDLAEVESAATEARRSVESDPPSSTPQPQGPNQSDAAAEPGIPPEVEAKEVPSELPQPRRRISQRVHAKRSRTDQIVNSRRVTDGNRCEELAERFEESQGRFPLLVSSLQGTEGFGCDVLSFSTDTERDQFRREHGKPLDLVRRFIEVKGRSSPRGSVPLAGNEKNAARQHQHRYHLYRVYEAKPGQKWQVIELSDPLAYDWEVTYDVDLLRRPETRCWAVEPASPFAHGDTSTP